MFRHYLHPLQFDMFCRCRRRGMKAKKKKKETKIKVTSRGADMMQHGELN